LPQIKLDTTNNMNHSPKLEQLSMIDKKSLTVSTLRSTRPMKKLKQKSKQLPELVKNRPSKSSVLQVLLIN
jgi:hypothetical protein